MEPLGIMLYGYGEDDSIHIREVISELLDSNVALISASDREDSAVIDILEEGGSGDFEDRDTKILMFLGFDDSALSRVMSNFPKRDGLRRPIFCALTETNINWKISTLLKDLLEEEAYWKRRKNDSEDQTSP
ncbi:MAG: DUF3783 domain-containing protein [Thermoplasmatota archaeon]